MCSDAGIRRAHKRRAGLPGRRPTASTGIDSFGRRIVADGSGARCGQSSCSMRLSRRQHASQIQLDAQHSVSIGSGARS